MSYHCCRNIALDDCDREAEFHLVRIAEVGLSGLAMSDFLSALYTWFLVLLDANMTVSTGCRCSVPMGTESFYPVARHRSV